MAVDIFIRQSVQQYPGLIVLENPKILQYYNNTTCSELKHQSHL